MPETTVSKQEWRRFAARLFALCGREERRGLDRVLAAKVWERVGKENGGILLGFSALPDEPDISPFYRKWIAGGGRLALPVWKGGTEMDMRLVADPAVPMRPGRGGIMEPGPECAPVTPEELGLALVPGRLFSERCERLGRGAGCYDVLLGRLTAEHLGVAYDFQIFPVLPTNAHDVPLAAVITPSRVIVRGGMPPG